MLKKFLQPSIVAVLLAVNMFDLITVDVALAQKAAEASMDEDDIITVNGLNWGAQGWHFSKVVEVKDTLGGNVVGRVVIDRHGIDGFSSSSKHKGFLGGLFGGGSIVQNPFSGPAPGRLVFVSLWGSKIEGCYAELIIQAANTNGQNDQAITRAIIPEKMEIGINGQILELDAPRRATEKAFYKSYTYTTYENNTQSQHPGTWYMTRNLFAIDSQVANILSNAPRQNVKIRITLANNNTQILPIGEKTVGRWKDVYSFNPSCRSPNQMQPGASKR